MNHWKRSISVFALCTPTDVEYCQSSSERLLRTSGWCGCIALHDSRNPIWHRRDEPVSATAAGRSNRLIWVGTLRIELCFESRAMANASPPVYEKEAVEGERWHDNKYSVRGWDDGYMALGHRIMRLRKKDICVCVLSLGTAPLYLSAI